MSSKKLEQVLEYLINNNEAKAKELLHQVFIEKARSIHEELINMDEEDELNEMGGDEGDELRDDVMHHDDDMEEMSDEIEAEETMAEEEDVDMDVMDMDVADDDFGDEEGEVDADMDMDMDMEPMGDEDHASIEDSMEKLEDALAELKAEFEKLEAGEGAEDEVEAGEEELDSDAEDAEGEEFGAEEDSEEAGEEDLDETLVTEEDKCEEEDDEEEMDESWLSEFDDLDESVSLEKVAVPHGEGEVGSGHYSKVEANTKSPVGKAPASTLGAKPVKTGEGPTASGYKLETAPSTKGQLPNTEDNRRKKATDKTSKVSKEGNSSAKLNKATSDGFGEIGKKSPLSSSPRK